MSRAPYKASQHSLQTRQCCSQTTIKNKLEGVTKGFLIYLRIAGIGYRAAQEGQTLTFKLGYSHDIAYELPASVRGFLPEPTLVGLYGIDKNQVLPSKPLASTLCKSGSRMGLTCAYACQQVTQVAANIVRLRPPSAYKGQGIRMANTTPRLKPGKRK